MKRWFNVIIILKAYLVAITIFFCFRLILFFTELNRIESVSGEFSDIVSAFIMGIRFDIVISGYILILPFLVLTVMFILNKNYSWVYRFVFYWIFALFSLAFIVCSADIPYFNQFFSRFSVSAFQWTDNAGFVLKMIIQEPRYIIILIPLVIFLVAFFLILKRIVLVPRYSPGSLPLYWKIPVSILIMGLIFVGIRGRLQEKSPIKVGTAYFSDNAFLNQLGLNPVFTLIRSYLDVLNERNKMVTFLEKETSISNVRNYLGIGQPIGDYPVARYINSDSTGEKRYNVILVIMESMSAGKLNRHGNMKNLTPFLDSIANCGYYFENIYTAGIHTFNGVFSTLFSFPAIYRQNPMKESTMFRYNGIGYTLRENGYSTTYFTTHDGQFDNIEGFLRANDFENIITLDDYPAEKARTTLGVPDDYMFEFSMPVIDGLYESNKPFLVTFMTASDHGPYYLPDYFKPRNTEIRDQMVEYADWSLRKLISLASAKPWFHNTLFVFIADHGSPINAVYDIPLDYHHTPLVVYAPEILSEAGIFNCIGGQIDVFPTIMGILNQPYINNTLGIDLCRENRPFIFFNHEDKFGVIDQEHLLILKNDGSKSLYEYRNKDKRNYKEENQDLIREMEEYTFSNLQVFQYLMQNNTRFIERDYHD
jgi:phosphoglycerol transferase MdoB-like AlkP superfamily enzyme